MENFSKSRIWDKASEESPLVFFGDIPKFSYKKIIGYIKGSLRTKNELYPFSRFDTSSGCDRRTDRATADIALV